MAAKSKKTLDQIMTLDDIREIWDFMSSSQLRLKSIESNIEQIKSELGNKCDTCPFSAEKEDYKKMKKDVAKLVIYAGIFFFALTSVVIPLVMKYL